MLEPDPVAGTGVDAAGLRVGITNGETGPGAIGIPAEPVGVGEFRGRTRPGPDFDGGGLGGFQRRGHRVQSVALLGDEAAGDPQECGLPAPAAPSTTTRGRSPASVATAAACPESRYARDRSAAAATAGTARSWPGLRAADGEPTDQIVLDLQDRE